mmetsp:Transcript_45443/g.83137  ORF Transcript_45443/g.83137 Transcript_45443/m.83137 type:complete len:80 (+) Transcript_45443:1102-1341(+)
MKSGLGREEKPAGPPHGGKVPLAGGSGGVKLPDAGTLPNAGGNVGEDGKAVAIEGCRSKGDPDRGGGMEPSGPLGKLLG